MAQKDIIIRPDTNFHHLAGEDLLARDDARFSEYRKKWKEWPKFFRAGDFPLFIDIEATSVCNLKCPFCARTLRENLIKKGFISFAVVKRIIDEGAENNLYGVKFNIRGEPLLHPEIHRFIRYAKQKGLIDVYFNTNAVLLTKDTANNLIDAGLDRISISIEGCTRDIYEKHRVGADFKTILANIRNIQSLKKRRGVKHPKVRVQTVMTPDIQTTFDDYRRFWEKEADEVAALDYREMKEKRIGVRFAWACYQLWQRMAVWWDGTILPCNQDEEGLIALGNINEISIKQAWNSEKLNRIRGCHKQGRAHEVSACDGCYLRDSEMPKLKNKS